MEKTSDFFARRTLSVLSPNNLSGLHVDCHATDIAGSTVSKIDERPLQQRRSKAYSTRLICRDSDAGISIIVLVEIVLEIFVARSAGSPTFGLLSPAAATRAFRDLQTYDPMYHTRAASDDAAQNVFP